MEFHPAANLFPLLEGDDFLRFMSDVVENGLREKIKTLGGKILDGRNRYRACEESGIKPRFEELAPDTDPVRYVVSLNLHRRHLNESQRALVAARIVTMRQGGDRGNQYTGGKPSIDGLAKPLVSQEDAAKLLNVSVASVGRAATVVRHAVPEISKMVEAGDVKVHAAREVASMPKPKQRELAAAGPQAVREAAARIDASRPCRSRNTAEEASGEEQPEEESNGAIEVKGVGVLRANEAINSLTRIPKNDPLRKRGFQIVTDWIRHNK